MGGPSLDELLVLVVKEGRRRILSLAAIFSAIALIGLVVALFRPKVFQASALILIEPRSVISPSIATQSGTDVGLMKQIVLGRKTLRELLKLGGWMDGPLDPRKEEHLLQELKARIQIETPRPELVRISYADSDAQRSFEITQKITEIFIRESTLPQERESKAAFRFIDQQVNEYAAKLAEAHEAALAYYRSHEAAKDRRGDPADVAPRDRGAQLSPAALAALRAEEATLLSELERKRPVADPTEAEARYRARSGQLKAELDRMLASLTDEHPDVKRVRRELERTEQLEEQARRDLAAAARATAELDDEMAQAARARLEEVQRRIAAATGVQRPRPRLPASRTDGPAETDPELRMVSRDATMSELLRRYEATRDIYQDLLRRRENLRVSLELSEQQGVNLKVQEAAELPVTAVSARMMHVVAIGLVFALLVPLGLLFALVKFDPRVRSASQIKAAERVPFLVSIPYAPRPAERFKLRMRTLLAGLMVASVFGVYVVVFVLRLKASS